MKLSRIIVDFDADAHQVIREQFGMDAIIVQRKERENGLEFLIGTEEEDSPRTRKEQPLVRREIKPAVVENSMLQNSSSSIGTQASGASINGNLADPILRRTSRIADTLSKSAEEHGLTGSSQPAIVQTSQQSRPVLPTSLPSQRPSDSRSSDHKSANGLGENIFASSPSTSKPLVPSEPTESEKRLEKEISSIKEIVSEQMQMLKWRETIKENPLRAEIWTLLTKIGFSPLFSRKVVENLPANMDKDQSLGWVKSVLMHNLPIRDPRESLVEKGGTYALVGPTGVGKTTTTAKLAAKCIMKFGPESMGLITTDSYRIGAQDQLRIYGKILGVPVFTAQNEHELTQIRESLKRKHLVVIDTVGMAQRDSRILTQTKMLSHPDIKRVLLLNASSQPQTLNDVVIHYKQNGLDSCILSKLDEAIFLGGALDVVIRTKLPIHFLATGQRVPEDLFYPEKALLVNKAVTVSIPSPFSESDTERAWRISQSHNNF